MLFKGIEKTNESKSPSVVDTLPRTVKQVKNLIEELKLLNYTPTQDDIAAFCLSIMSDKTASHKDRLQAARLLAQIKGYLDKDKGSKGINGARIKWAVPVDTTAQSSDLT